MRNALIGFLVVPACESRSVYIHSYDMMTRIREYVNTYLSDIIPDAEAPNSVPAATNVAANWISHAREHTRSNCN